MRDRSRHLSGLLVLAGSVRVNPIESAVGRSILNLPVGRERSILDLWRELASRVSDRLEQNRITVRIAHGAKFVEPDVAVRPELSPVELESDPVELRGPGGVIADIARRFSPDEYLLIASGTQFPLVSADRLADEIRESDADVLVWTQHDGAPITLILARCGALRSVPEVGYVDFKEQALPKIAASHEVRVSRFDTTSLLPIRQFSDYLFGLRHLHRTFAAAASSSNLGRWDDPWQPVFGLVEDGGIVGSGVSLCDSVVLSGGEVEDGALVVRSIVCGGGVVREGTTAHELMVLGV